jgi:hypothetical protein
VAKGDTIEVMVGTADGSRTYRLTAGKAGRRVTHTTRVRRKVAWLDVEEVTRTNRPTGNLVSIPLAAVLGLSVSTIDVPDEPKARPRKARVAPPADEAGLGL